jgi:CTP synthase (UTP-ammonia lyase)
MEEQKETIKKNRYGATMRLGAWNCKLIKGLLVEKHIKQKIFRKT